MLKSSSNSWPSSMPVSSIDEPSWAIDGQYRTSPIIFFLNKNFILELIDLVARNGQAERIPI